MIEYIYDLIRVSAGEDAIIEARITDVDGSVITEGCNFVLYQGDKMAVYYGTCEDGIWQFGVATSGLPKGRYQYCIRQGDASLCFLKPLHIV